MLRRLLIVGASGHGKVCAEIAKWMKQWDKSVFADDNSPATLPYPIFGGADIARDEDCIIAIGNNRTRDRLSTGRKLVTLVHPNAVIGERVEIEKGSVVMDGAVINADVKIGESSIVNTTHR